MRKCIETVKDGIFGSNYTYIGRLFTSKNMPHRKCIHLKLFITSKELGAHLTLQE